MGLTALPRTPRPAGGFGSGPGLWAVFLSLHSALSTEQLYRLMQSCDERDVEWYVAVVMWRRRHRQDGQIDQVRAGQTDPMLSDLSADLSVSPRRYSSLMKDISQSLKSTVCFMYVTTGYKYQPDMKGSFKRA